MKVKVNGAWVDVPAFKVVEVKLDDVRNIFEGGGTKIVVPEGVEKLRNYAFYQLNYNTQVFVDIILPSTIKSFAYQSFAQANIKHITIPQNVTTLGTYTFNGCASLEDATLNCNITFIAENTFASCKALTSVLVNCPHLVQVRTGVFNGCTALEEVDFTACQQVPTLSGVSAFNQVPTTCTIKVPSALYSAWTTATNWSTLVAQGYNFVGV